MKINSRLSPFFLALQINGVFLVTFFLTNSMFSGDIFNNYTVFIFMIIMII